MANLTTTVVNDAWLLFSRTGKRLPITSLQVFYALDNLPTAVLAPAFGAVLVGQDTKDRQPITDILYGDPVSLSLALDGKERILFRGYIDTIAPSATGTMFNKSLGFQLSLSHVTSVAAGPPPVSYLYAGETLDLGTLWNRKFQSNIFNSADTTNGTSPNELEETLVALTTTYNLDGATLDKQPAGLLTLFVRELLKRDAGGVVDGLNLADIFRAYQGATLNGLPVDAVGMTLLRIWYSSWRNNNAWQQLQQTCAAFFLHLVPFAGGVYVADPLAMGHLPQVVLSGDDYLSFHGQSSNLWLAPIDGVAIRSPNGQLNTADADSYYNFAWPDLTPSGGVVPRGKWYHLRDFPEWLAAYKDIQDTQSGKLPSDTVPAPNAVAKAKAQAVCKAQLQNAPSVCQRVAQVFCSEMRSQNKTAKLVLPYREDLMPGTRVSVDARGSALAFMGDVLYGMITQTTIIAGTESSGSNLSLELSLSLLRNQATNEDPNFSLSQHPLYAAEWPGCKLDGSLLT